MKFTPKSNKIENKRELSRSLPSHVPTKEVLEQARLSEQEIVEAVKLEPFLRKHQLPQGVERNLIAANFDDKDRLVLVFDTCERIITNPLDIKTLIETHVVGFKEKIILGEEVDYVQEVFIGTPASVIEYPALIFEETTVDGQTVYCMKVNVPV